MGVLLVGCLLWCPPGAGFLSSCVQLEGVLEVVQAHHLLVQRVQLQAPAVVGIAQGRRRLGVKHNTYNRVSLLGEPPEAPSLLAASP